MICPICKFKCKTNASFKHHVSGKHKNISKLELEKLYIKYVLMLDVDFYDIINDYNLGLCIDDLIIKYHVPRTNINKIFNLLGVKRRTNSQSKKTLQYKEKYLNTIKNKYGVENVSCIQEVKNKKIETSIKNNGYANNFCNHSIREKALKNIDFKKLSEINKKSNLLKYGVENVAQVPEIARKISIAQKKLHSKYSYEDRLSRTKNARNSYINVSKLEVKIAAILDEISIEYTRNKFICGYNFDFIFKNKIILEIQGDYWHGNPIKYKFNDILIGGKIAQNVWDKDLRKKNRVENMGYKVFYLWETDINKMKKNEIINFIKNILK